MPPVYALISTAVPAPIVSAGLLDPATSSPVVAERVTPGTTTAGLAAINHNATRLDNAARYGGSSLFSVKAGLDLSAGSGLTLNISAGVGNIDGHIYHDAGTLALTDSTRNYIWLTRAGALSATTSTTPPTANQSLFLGSALCAGGVITAVDYSGRLDGLGGIVARQTADTGAPADTPPAGARFLTRTAAGLYLWDGTAYYLLAGVPGGAGGATRLVKTVTGIADATATALLTVTVPNAAHAAVVNVRILASLGAGGALGAFEASATLEGAVVIARRAGLATVPTAATAVLTASSAVAGAATITLAYDVSGLTGGNSATQTFTIRATVTRGSGSSTNHQAVVVAEVVSAVAGVTVS